jgi:acyl-CoA dehydrogenase
VTDELRELRELSRGTAAPEPAAVRDERLEVRRFLAEATRSGLMRPQCDSWLSGFSPAMSAALGARGWIGITWPSRYGGRDRDNQLRFAVIEELLAAGAPVAAHWFADRQVGPGILRYGTPGQRLRFLPEMARGLLYFCIGMSEPQSGSDLASVRTRAHRTEQGWLVTGSKIWTSHADRAHFMLALVRTAGPDTPAASALTQLIIDMTSPGVTVRPIRMLDGREHFCEVFLDEVFVPDAMVLGGVGAGWHQVLAELAFERSGPERLLSTFPLLTALVDGLGDAVDPGCSDELGRIISRLGALRAVSARISARLDDGRAPGSAAALVKDLGTQLETDIIEFVRRWRPPGDLGCALDAQLLQAQAHAPGFTLRGGTSEILRNLAAKALLAS